MTMTDENPINSNDYEYVGFWIRVAAALIDSLLVIAVTLPVLRMIYGPGYFEESADRFVAGPADFLISWIFPALAVVLFWRAKQATPGKMVFDARIVDARTGAPMTFGQSIGRYLGYFVSTIPFGLGLIWVAFDARKQGWHDKLAGTVVIRTRRRGPQPVRFEGR
jgi:uncharacterized RDD family membrane protein YckC